MHAVFIVLYFFFFKQKTAYEMRISDWSSDVCSSDLMRQAPSATSARTGPDACASVWREPLETIVSGTGARRTERSLPASCLTRHLHIHVRRRNRSVHAGI